MSGEVFVIIWITGLALPYTNELLLRDSRVDDVGKQGVVIDKHGGSPPLHLRSVTTLRKPFLLHTTDRQLLSLITMEPRK